MRAGPVPRAARVMGAERQAVAILQEQLAPGQGRASCPCTLDT